MMNNISDFSKCSNCGACYNACPKSAITVESDMFYKPVVDENKCIECGLCKTVCPVNTPAENQNLKAAYAMYHTDPEVVKKSSSGGVFFAIANYVIENLGGVVYACAYTDDCREVVVKSTDEVSIYALMKSKYVESKVNLSFREIKASLTSGKNVLFCGAPCQVAGLKRYLNKDYENLITCDFSCGGMPSHYMYQQYLNGMENKLKSSIESVDFRAKKYGWTRHSIRIKAKGGKCYENFAHNDPYFYLFIGNHMSIREYCTECDFANNHYADIILADFWGYKKISKIKNDDTGLSLLITNSEKGEQLIEKISPQVVTTIMDLEKASYNMKKRNPDKAYLQTRQQFIDDCYKNGFLNTAKKVKKPTKIRLKSRYLLSKLKEQIF